MITINSLSGGRTSSYMAVHYPADYNVFALVRIEDLASAPKDKKLVQMVSDKIGMDFIATAEDDLTLYTMFDLEQMIGKNITWVTGKSFDRTTNRRKHLPNIEWRYCTLELKIRPIKKWCKQFGKIDMNIGFRYDEKERGENMKIEQGWRIVSFPMIRDKVTHYRVYKWVQSTDLVFSDDSNCVGCYWKPLQQLRKNWQDNPKKMEWFAQQERNGRRFKKEMTYDQVREIGLQTDFFLAPDQVVRLDTVLIKKQLKTKIKCRKY